MNGCAMKTKQYLRPDEVAEMLSISVATVYRLIAHKKLRAIKIQSVYRIPADAIDS